MTIEERSVKIQNLLNYLRDNNIFNKDFVLKLIDNFNESFVYQVDKLKNPFYFMSRTYAIKDLYDEKLKALDNAIFEIKNILKEIIPTQDDKIFLILKKDFNLLSREEKIEVLSYFAKNYNLRINYNHEFNDRDLYLSKIYDFLKIEFAKKMIFSNKIFNQENHFVFLSELLEVLQEEKEKLIYNRDNVELFSLDKDQITPENLEMLERVAKTSLRHGKEVCIGVDNNMATQSNQDNANYLYSKRQLSSLIVLNNNLSKEGMKEPIKFSELEKFSTKDDFDKAWTLKNVLDSNYVIDRIVDDIKNKNLTPFETVLFIYNLVRKIPYKQNEKIEDPRVIVGVLKDNQAVCSGYASLIKAIIDRLNIPELKCDLVGCTLYERKGVIPRIKGGHCHNIIKISDSKYDIDGTYALDATNNDDIPFNYSLCLFPIEDLTKFRHLRYQQTNQKNRLDNIIFRQENFKDIMKSDISYKFKHVLEGLKLYFVQPDVVKENPNGKVISIDCFKKAIRSLVEKEFFNNGDMDIDEFIDGIVVLSTAAAKSCFKNNAKNCFVHCDLSLFDEKEDEDENN